MPKAFEHTFALQAALRLPCGMSKPTMSGTNSGERHQMDPVVCLNEQCLIHIFSFVWGGASGTGTCPEDAATGRNDGENNTTVNAVEAFSIHQGLATVSRGWKAALGKIIGQCVPLLSVNCEEIGTYRVRFGSWLCDHQFPIGTLFCGELERPEIATRILEERLHNKEIFIQQMKEYQD